MANGKARGLPVGYVLAGAATLAVALAVAAGLWLSGSPTEQRALRTDERRVDDLRRLAGAVELYWTRNKRLPATLTELSSLGGAIGTADPQTGEAYGFRPKDGSSYELCASFARPSEDILRDSEWTHQAGPQCFTREADRQERNRRN